MDGNRGGDDPAVASGYHGTANTGVDDYYGIDSSAVVRHSEGVSPASLDSHHNGDGPTLTNGCYETTNTGLDGYRSFDTSAVTRHSQGDSEPGW